MIKYILQVVCVNLFCMSICMAQATFFDKTFNVSNNLEFGWSVLISPDSNFITLSNGTDLFTGDGAYTLSYFTNEGEIENNKVYQSTLSFAYVGLSNSLFKLPDNSGYMFGGNIDDNTVLKSQVMVVRFKNNGDTLFQKIYPDTLYSAPYFSTVTSDNKVLLTGFEQIIPDPADIFLMKTDLNGAEIWKKSFGTSDESDIGFTLFENKQHQYVIGGDKIYDGVDSNPWIIVTDTSGNIVKQKEFFEPFFYSCNSLLKPTIDYNYIMASCVDTVINPGDYPVPAFIGKLDTNLNFVWQTILNYPLDNGLYIVKQLQDSGYVFVGFQEGGNPNADEGWIGKLDKNGNKLWEHQYRHNNSLSNYFSDFQQTSDKGFIITGSTYGPNDQDLWLVKVDSFGCLQSCYTNAGTIESGPNAISLQCYPNPASSQTTVLFNVPDKAKEAELLITDLSGQVIERISVDHLSNTFDLSLLGWTSGVYVCSLVIDDIVTKSVKLVVYGESR